MDKNQFLSEKIAELNQVEQEYIQLAFQRTPENLLNLILNNEILGIALEKYKNEVEELAIENLKQFTAQELIEGIGEIINKTITKMVLQNNEIVHNSSIYSCILKQIKEEKEKKQKEYQEVKDLEKNITRLKELYGNHTPEAEAEKNKLFKLVGINR